MFPEGSDVPVVEWITVREGQMRELHLPFFLEINILSVLESMRHTTLNVLGTTAFRFPDLLSIYKSALMARVIILKVKSG